MPEITTVTLNQLNALTRSSESATLNASKGSAINLASELSGSIATRVTVTQVSANTITLSNPQTKQSVQIPSAVLTALGSLKAGQAFDLVNVPNKTNTYALVPLISANKTLANASTTALPSIVLASTKLSVNDNQLNAIVSKASNAGDIRFTGSPIINIQGVITAISANQVTVKFSVPGTNLPTQQAQITLSKNQVDNLKVNSKVNIAVDISSKQAKIISLGNAVSVASSNNNLANSTVSPLKLNAQLSQLNSGVLPSKLLSVAILQQLNSATVNAPRVDAVKPASAPLTQLSIPLTDANLSSLPKALLNSLQSSIAAVNTNGAAGVSLLIDGGGKGIGNANTVTLSVAGTLNKAPIELNVSQLRALVPALDNKPTTLNALASTLPSVPKGTIGPAQNQPGFIANRAELFANNVNNGNGGDNKSGTQAIVNPNNQADAVSFKTNRLLEQLTKYVAANSTNTTSANALKTNAPATNTILTQLLAQLTSTKATGAIEQLASVTGVQKSPAGLNVQALKNQVHSLLKTASTPATNQTQTLANIINALDNQADIEALSPETQTLLKNIKDIVPAPTNTNPLDARAIQQLVGAPLNNTPINALSPTASSGFLSGLVTLLQVGLASKLQRLSNKQASKLQDQLPEVIKSLVPNIQNAQSAKLMQDFRQFDAKHTLSAEVAKMLFSHQQHKLNSIESSLQGQDQLYYALPNAFSKNADDIEFVVKRETREKKGEDNEASISSWYLTMKLDVGEMGQVLAKTQLTNDELKLQLYTSNTALKNKTLDMLPYLQKRLASLGINVVEKSCQLGKIPKQLKSEHYQVFETQV